MPQQKSNNLSSSQRGSIAERNFSVWLEKSGYRILGRESKKSVRTGGWPDFLTAKNGKFYMFEVKGIKHRLDDHQKEVLTILKKIGKVQVMRVQDEAMKKFSDVTRDTLK